MIFKKFFLVLFLLSGVLGSWASEPNTFIATISGFTSPYVIAIAPNNLYAYVTDNPAVRVININQTSSSFNTLVDAPALLNAFNDPQSITITPNSNFAYVADTGSNSVLIINTNPASSGFNTLVNAPALVGSFNSPNGVAVTPDGTRVYVTNADTDNVNVIDINPASPTYNTILSTPSLDAILISPFDIAITPDGTRVYVSNLNGTMSVIDSDPASPNYNTLLSAPGLDAVNAQPEGFAITANGFYAYVSDGAGNDVTALDVNPASPNYNTVISAPNLLNAFNAPNDVATTPDGTYAYVSNFLGTNGSVSSVSVIDTNPSSPTFNSTLNTPGLAQSGTQRYFALAVTPDARYVYAVDGFNAVVQVIYTGILDAPTNLTGCSGGQDIFLLQKDIFNRLSWSGPVFGVAPVAYNIYSNTGLTQLVGTVSASGPLQLLFHNQTGVTGQSYYVVSVGASGATSAVAATTISQPCFLSKSVAYVS